MKLEENMYVRTRYGNIAKIINKNDYREPSLKYGVEASYLKDIMFIGDDDIVKASYNIIDILEVGDYVNGQKVYYDEELNFLYVQSFDADGEFYQESITKQSFIDNIKSVITHEQIEQMAYRVGE